MKNAHIAGLAAAVFSLSITTFAADAATVRWTRASDALPLDPHAPNDGVTHALLHHIYESLV
mgnify:CR=1 FL=1